jgi:fermentation-respiration switch protein FrsA (DUF1100 family)
LSFIGGFGVIRNQSPHGFANLNLNIAYSEGLAAVLREHGKQYEFFIYEGDGHNLISPYFGAAMVRAVEFFRDNL